ncbi:MAG: CsiV family protein [Gammaproteobacteria bacterium]
MKRPRLGPCVAALLGAMLAQGADAGAPASGRAIAPTAVEADPKAVPGQPAAPPIPWLQIEVIVFRPLQADPRAVADDGAPDTGRAVVLPDEPVPLEQAVAAVDARTRFERVPPLESRLQSVRERLERSGRYQVLMQQSWRQPGGVQAGQAVRLTEPAVADVGAQSPESASVPLPPVLPVPPLLAGTVRVRDGASLLIDADVLFAGDAVPARLTETRKARVGELHYFDHPRLGLIVEVSDVLPEEARGAQDEPPDTGGDPEPGPAAAGQIIYPEDD